MAFDDLGETVKRVCRMSGAREPTSEEIGRLVDSRYHQEQERSNKELALANAEAEERQRVEREHQGILACAERAFQLAQGAALLDEAKKAHLTRVVLTDEQQGAVATAVGHAIAWVRTAREQGTVTRAQAETWLTAEFRRWSRETNIPIDVAEKVSAVLEVTFPTTPAAGAAVDVASGISQGIDATIVMSGGGGRHASDVLRMYDLQSGRRIRHPVALNT